MNFIKKTRQQIGYTQKVLAEKTGLSLRTIQRIETSDKPPKGHTLTVLAKVFDTTPNTLQKHFQSIPSSVETSDKAAIKLINLATLGIFFLPLGNILLPFWIWRKKRTSKLVEEMGRKIINVQILWTIIWYISLSIAPFLTSSFPLILWVLFLGLIINILLLLATAYWTERDHYAFLNLPFSLI